MGRHFLVVVDDMSKYPDVVAMPSSTSTVTINTLRKLFDQHGVPETIVSDNGTQFTSHEFRQFCKLKAINLILSPPHHPPSNGQAELFVDTFKRGLLKLKGEGDVDQMLDTFLLAYRTTPKSTPAQQRGPTEWFFGCKPRATLDLLLLPPKQPTGRDFKMENQLTAVMEQSRAILTAETQSTSSLADLRTGVPDLSLGKSADDYTK
ncbi:hypothetical protein Cfor_05252 [Coptotermes formosanus]|jgi:transposase InsO family protein|uniref:Integrase catalytic domain-containing protein n=1 Tax=Coptotermes formosanus TaxID=36987 RepID=A0A6L2PTF0_COPFO|nr:hypothetical protein Cfor_05252 [Coptotermes formosanus]